MKGPVEIVHDDLFIYYMIRKWYGYLFNIGKRRSRLLFLRAASADLQAVKNVHLRYRYKFRLGGGVIPLRPKDKLRKLFAGIVVG